MFSKHFCVKCWEKNQLPLLAAHREGWIGTASREVESLEANIEAKQPFRKNVHSWRNYEAIKSMGESMNPYFQM